MAKKRNTCENWSADTTHIKIDSPQKNNKQNPVLSWEDHPGSSLEIPRICFHPFLLISPLTLFVSYQKIYQKTFGDQLPSPWNSPFKDNPSAIPIPAFQNWQNRLIHGDSLRGMAKLLSDGYHQKVQMVYMDPPFGIDYNAHYHSGTQSTEGYLDTWQFGRNSYLEYLRERFLIIHQLLHPSGSIFVQIGEENVHYVRCLLDEIFGIENYMNMITFRTAISTNRISNVADYLLWYAKDKSQVRYHKLFKKRPLEKVLKTFTYKQKHPESGKDIAYKAQELVKRINPKNPYRMDRQYEIQWKGRHFKPPKGFEWRWTKTAVSRLIQLNRVAEINGKLYGIRYEKDFPAMLMTNIWTDTSTSTFAAKKHYSVHTNPKVIHRCVSMTTDPGDLVLDPTMGSGTTAVVAENIGRRWIGFDTSPTAILSTINWLIGKEYPIYSWNHENSDYDYVPVSKVSLSKLAHNQPTPSQPWYGKPKVLHTSGRICSSFSFEVMSSNNHTPDLDHIEALLRINGIFLPDGTQLKLNHLHAVKDQEYKEFDALSSNLLKIHGSVNSTEFLVLILTKSDPSNEKILCTILANWQWSENFPIFLFSSHYSLGFLDFLLTLSENASSKSSIINPEIFWGFYHPDLNIRQLNFSNHPEAFRLTGICRQLGNSLELSFFHPESKELQMIDSSNVACWAVVSKPDSIENLWESMGTCMVFQLPYYKKFIAKRLKPIYSMSPKEFFGWKELQNQIEYLPSPILYVIDSRGLFYFGKWK